MIQIGCTTGRMMVLVENCRERSTDRKKYVILKDNNTGSSKGVRNGNRNCMENIRDRADRG